MTKAIIRSLKAREILDSRARPTLEVEVTLESGFSGRAAVPAGASTGGAEAVELRDRDPNRYNGQGLLQAVDKVIQLQDLLTGQELSQTDLDRILIETDGTPNKMSLGANTCLGISLAFAQALAHSRNLSLYQLWGQDQPEPYHLPQPMFNIINGGAHADSGLSFQEFMVVPQITPFREALRCGVEIYHSLKKLLTEQGYHTSTGDEGGFAPALESNREALELIQKAAEQVGYRPTEHYRLSLDVAANEFYQDGQYHLRSGEPVDRSAVIAELIELSRTFSLYSIEDPLHEDDAAGFAELLKQIGEETMIVGDDLLVTNAGKIKAGAEQQSVNAVIIKPNQVGTVTETIEALSTGNHFGLKPIISHRSGETEDVSIAHLAVGLRAPLVKFGAPARGERTAKYNELLRIEAALDL